jgi:hypothetical protein
MTTTSVREIEARNDRHDIGTAHHGRRVRAARLRCLATPAAPREDERDRPRRARRIDVRPGPGQGRWGPRRRDHRRRRCVLCRCRPQARDARARRPLRPGTAARGRRGVDARNRAPPDTGDRGGQRHRHSRWVRAGARMRHRDRRTRGTAVGRSRQVRAVPRRRQHRAPAPDRRTQPRQAPAVHRSHRDGGRDARARRRHRGRRGGGT